MRHFPVVVVGRGPAGLSAAIYLCRNGVKPLVIGRKPPLAGYTIENYLGFPEPVKGQVILERGERQAAALGAAIEDAPVVGLAKSMLFTVSTPEEDISSEAIVLAVGATEVSDVPITGIARFLGKGVSSCAICDGHTFRSSRVVVLGAGDYAAHEALLLASVGASVSLLSCGQEWEISPHQREAIEHAGVTLMLDRATSVEGHFAVEGINLEAGGLLPCEGIFIATHEPRARELAQKIGVRMTADGYVETDFRTGTTSVEGVYAAGDCTGGMRQISVAVGQGAIAGVSASTFAVMRK
ncbi:MAG: NAD(P)/FAD-dependent oxidoreductase [Candidatus Brocadiia bacterium]